MRFSTSVIYPIRVVGSSGVTHDAADTMRFYALRMPFLKAADLCATELHNK